MPERDFTTQGRRFTHPVMGHGDIHPDGDKVTFQESANGPDRMEAMARVCASWAPSVVAQDGSVSMAHLPCHSYVMAHVALEHCTEVTP